MTGNNYTNKLGVDTNEFKKAMKELNAGLNSLKQQINYAAASSGDYNNRIELLTKNISENVKKEELLEEVLKKLKDATNKDVKAIANAEAALYKQKTATELAKKDLDKFKTAHDESMIAEDKHKVKIDTLSLALSETLINAVRKACSALVDFAKETINTGMQFESAFAGVRKVVSGTEEDFKGLEKEIRQTALERPISAEQLSSIYQMGSQLGIAKESLKDFSDSIIDLAKTSNLTEEAGATMIAQYANVMNLPQEDYRRFASTLSYLGSTTATTESAIMELMSRLSGAGATIGLTHQDLLALATSMGSVGINAEAGGSAISTILSKIDMAVDKNGESLTTWANVAGMTAETFKKAWKEDTMSAVKAVISGLGDAKKGGESLNLILEDLGIKNIRQLDTMKKLTNASELLTKNMQKANKEWETASFLGSSASQVYNTVESQLQILKNTFAEMQISIYEGFRQPLSEAFKELSSFLKSDDAKRFATELSNALSGIVKTATIVIKAVISNFDKVIAAIKTAIKLVPMIVTQKVILAMFSFVSAIQKAGGAMALFNSIVVANPLTLLATAIAAVVFGLGTYCYKTLTAKNATQEHTKELEKQKQQLIENREEREKAITNIDNEADRTVNLVNELKTLVDENGKVKEGYNDRVNTIIPLIEQATGTEIKLIDGQIVKYNKLIGTLDQVIAKKRLEAKINAYQGDYEDALREEEEHGNEVIAINNKIRDAEKRLQLTKLKDQQEIAQKREQLEKNGIRNSQILAQSSRTNEIKAIENEIEELKKQKELIDSNAKERKDIIDKYEKLIKEQYEEYGNGSNSSNETNNSVNDSYAAGSDAGNSYVKGFSDTSQKIETEVKKSSKKVKEETKTSYQDLLEQEKTYGNQLKNYLGEIKKGNSDITIEMVEDTKKKLEETQKKVKEMKSLLGDSTISTKLILNDETYGGLTKKENELKTQLSTLQIELANGNQNITTNMLNNVQKQIDQVSVKIKALKNEWDELGEDGEISDEFESENTNHISQGVIFDRGVLGENVVEMVGAGKDAALAYLEGYKAEQEKINEQIITDAQNRANQEAINYQMATIDPSNIAVYDQTEKYLAESKQTSQSQGLTDNAYKVINAETWTLNQAIAAAMQIDFTIVGKYICDGVAAGIEQNKHVVIDAVRAMMEEANSAAEDEEEEHSPSKVFYRYGRFMDLGLANGIRDYASTVSRQVQDMTSKINDSINLTNSQVEAKRYGRQDLIKGTGVTEINYNFTQNNTSAKSLDTLAIYQQSKSMLKRVARNQYV